GSPRQTGQVLALGGASAASLAQPQNIFEAVRSWTWISMPITTSRSAAVGAAGAAISAAAPPSERGEEALDAQQGLLELGVRGRERGAHVALAARPEGAAGDDRDAV